MPASAFPILLVTHIALAVCLVLPSILLPFTLRTRRNPSGDGPGRFVRFLLWAQSHGTVVIGLIDNLLRPILVGRDTKLPDYMVLLSTLGGLVLFGINGFVIGPLIAALFTAFWGIFIRDFKEPEPPTQSN